MADVLIAIGDHRTSPVPALAPDNVDLLGQECIRCAHNRSDIEVVLEILDRNMEWMAFRIQIGDDRIELPVPVGVDHVAVVAVAQQVGIELRIIGDRSLPRADSRADLRANFQARELFGLVVVDVQGALFESEIGEGIRSAVGQTAFLDRRTRATVHDHGHPYYLCPGLDERIDGGEHRTSGSGCVLNS